MKHISRRLYPFLALLILLAASCTTPLKEVTYLNGINSGKDYPNGPVPDEYTIRANDQLFIQVISDNPLDVAFLNLNNASGASSMGSSTNSMELITYLVNEYGAIDYPYLGELKVKDLTIPEVKTLIQKEVDKYLTGAAVFVKQVNRTITVLGEVAQAGQQTMISNKLTIFEALGTAGDINDWGNRQTVKLVRETDTGKFIGELDLTDPNLINSPYYYILPHDVIYVEHRTKIYGAKNLSFATPVTIATSLVTIGLLIANLFVN
jgi:polysaccharide export outer membrane protein